MIKLFEHIGRYFMLLGKVFSRPEKARIYRKRIWFEIDALGFDSISLTTIISTFIGAVVALQMAITLESPFIPRFMIGYATREVMILEFSSTVVALILAGKVGSNIASEIGTMRITEQIDALEIMGVNSASYLILPKIVATVIFFPILTLFSIIVGILKRPLHRYCAARRLCRGSLLLLGTLLRNLRLGEGCCLRIHHHLYLCLLWLLC